MNLLKNKIYSTEKKALKALWPSQRCLNSCLLINLTLNFSNGDINVYDEGAVTPTELPNIWLLFRTPTCCYRNIHLPRLLITCTLNSPLLISVCSMWAKPISEEHTRACPLFNQYYTFSGSHILWNKWTLKASIFQISSDNMISWYRWSCQMSTFMIT